MPVWQSKNTGIATVPDRLIPMVLTYSNRKKKLKEHFFPGQPPFRARLVGGISYGAEHHGTILLRKEQDFCICHRVEPPHGTGIKPEGFCSVHGIAECNVDLLAGKGHQPEAALAFIVADAMAEKFGGDSLGEMKRNFDGYIKQVKSF